MFRCELHSGRVISDSMFIYPVVSIPRTMLFILVMSLDAALSQLEHDAV